MDLPDYWVTGVRYHDDEEVVKSFKLREDEEESLGDPEMKRRKKVVSMIRRGWEFRTLHEENGEVVPGDEVKVVEIDGDEYLRTELEKRDDIDGVPEF
ncbi:MAG: hypothetical protein SV760_08795 [Halobacteria archaeon]|nr:hypothetical protein [Halobacteria archaeon]